MAGTAPEPSCHPEKAISGAKNVVWVQGVFKEGSVPVKSHVMISWAYKIEGATPKIKNIRETKIL